MSKKYNELLEKYNKLKKYEKLLEKYNRIKAKKSIKDRAYSEKIRSNKINHATDSEKYQARLERNKKWKKENKKQLDKYNKKYYKKNKEEKLEKVHDYYFNTRKKKIEKARKKSKKRSKK